MEHLNKKEEEFVALGASIASNCIPCIAYHIGEAKKAGITVEQIEEAIALAKKIKEVPAELVLNTAKAHLNINPEECEGNKDSQMSDCKC